jgi:hypothetical protein
MNRRYAHGFRRRQVGSCTPWTGQVAHRAGPPVARSRGLVGAPGLVGSRGVSHVSVLPQVESRVRADELLPTDFERAIVGRSRDPVDVDQRGSGLHLEMAHLLVVGGREVERLVAVTGETS